MPKVQYIWENGRWKTPLESLEDELRIAVKNEDYRQAAKIRDEINKLKEELKEDKLFEY